MNTESGVVVVRLGHRVGRDERVTTHVGLTARAFGAAEVILPEAASGAAATVEDVTDRFGGPFAVAVVADPLAWLRSWDGAVVHLTMYGLPVQTVLDDVREATNPVAIVVGGGKVPGEVYEGADWNVAVTSQPHSEVAALGVFLDRYFGGEQLEKPWRDAVQRVVPSDGEKRLESLE